MVVQLAENDCRFVIAGGFGAVACGGSLLTCDVDVACDMSRENLHRILEALEGTNPVHRMTPERVPFTRGQVEQGGLKNLYLSTQLGQLDLRGEIKGIGGFEQCWKHSEPILIGGREIRILACDALILAKRAMGRPRDLHAVLELEVIRDRRLRGGI